MPSSDFLGFEGMVIGEFRPHLEYHPELSLLIYLSENATYVSVRIDNTFSIYRHGYNDKMIGIEFWIPYHPQRLLA